MRTARIIDELEAALVAGLNPQIELEASSYGKGAVDTIAAFSQGYEDPLRLARYNACIICPDQVRLERSLQLCRIPVDLVFAIQGPTKAIVMEAMKIYVDATGNLIEADPSLGGHAFEARFEYAEFVGPTPVNELIGVVIARLSVDADDLLQ